MNMKMSKGDAIAFLGLEKWDYDKVLIAPQKKVKRDIYVDGRGFNWAWINGEFCRVYDSHGYGYRAEQMC